MPQSNPNSFLLIDDDQIFNLLHQKLISQINPEASVKTFQSSRDALTFIKENDHIPEVLLIDIRMPDLNGFDLLQEFCKLSPERFKNSRLFFVTSSLDESDKEKGMSYPLINGYFLKPISVSEILTMLNAQ